LPILRGEVETASVAAELEREKQAITAELATMRTPESQLAEAVAAEERASGHAAASALPRQVVEEVAKIVDIDDEIHRLAGALAAAIRARKAAGLALADRAAAGSSGRPTMALPGASATPSRGIFKLPARSPTVTAMIFCWHPGVAARMGR
jgi:hypothetical protein